MQAYVARQPILDLSGKTVGYELLFRDSYQNSFPAIDPDEATSKIITQNHLSFGLEDICQNKLAFINFHEDSLLHHFPTSLDTQSTVIEILEGVSITEDLIASCKELKILGYKMALDDHNFAEEWRMLYPYISIIKVDISQFDQLEIELFAQFVKSEYPHIELLAERVETEQELLTLKEFGYQLFQGYFFAKPEIVEQTAFSSDKLKLLNLISVMTEHDVTFDDIAEVIETDLTISFKLLRFISTSSNITQSKITTVKHAISYLGLYETRKFVALLAIANLNEENCAEIHDMALVRAKFCEYMELYFDPNQAKSEAYLTGLLSMIAPILKTTPSMIIPKLPISESMKDALLEHSGKLGLYLKICELYEKGNWREVELFSEELGLSMDLIGDAYHKAIKWHADNPITAN